MKNLEVLKEEFTTFFEQEMREYFYSELILDEACLYSLFAGGKRIRPILTMIVSKMLGGDKQISMALGSAVEMIHTYSLIHDDLPAMDNDDYRRGKLTCHKVYGEAVAVLTGDTLITESPLYILQSVPSKLLSKDKLMYIIYELMNASGRVGMIKGQILDMKHENMGHDHLNPSEKLSIIKNIHNHKTGQLFALSCILGALCDQSTPINKKQIELLREFGMELGLLFQVRDDILDTTKSFKELGKTPGKDEASGKLTYVSILGTDGAKKMANEIYRNSLMLIDQFSKTTSENKSRDLIDLMKFLKKDAF